MMSWDQLRSLGGPSPITSLNPPLTLGTHAPQPGVGCRILCKPPHPPATSQT